MDKKLISISLTFCVLICLLVVGYGVYKKYGLSIPADFNTNETAQSVVTEPQKTEEIITEPTTNADNEIMIACANEPSTRSISGLNANT